MFTQSKYDIDLLPLLYITISIIFSFWAFTIGLAEGIFSIKRTHFTIAVTGAVFVITGSCITIIVFFISIPVLILGILSTVFIAVSRKEFIPSE